MDWAREARWARGPGPLGPGARARAPPGPSSSPHKQNRRSCSSFVFEKWPPPGKSWKNDFGHSLKPRERKILFRIAFNENSVRQNGTPVMPLLHFGHGWLFRSKTAIFCVNLATRGIIITITNVSGGRSRRGKSWLYYSALTLAGTKKRRPKT